MRAHLPRFIGAAAATLFFATAAQAQGKDHGKDKNKDKHHTEAVTDDNRHHDASHDVHHVDQHQVQNDPRYNHGQVVNGQYDPRYDQNGRRVPPGLAKKPGGMPPGQYKKYGANQGGVVLREVMGRRGYTVVRTADAGQSQYVYYRLNDGSVRRAVVSPGTDRLQFSNVPSSLLSEVLARLY
ncbi:MAG: hypothetical protein JWL95_1289 [Gemmatimonadetes bacterium]|nr:hypothetical protein [Gemmatimonadota bacterium]